MEDEEPRLIHLVFSLLLSLGCSKYVRDTHIHDELPKIEKRKSDGPILLDVLMTQAEKTICYPYYLLRLHNNTSQGIIRTHIILHSIVLSK